MASTTYKNEGFLYIQQNDTNTNTDTNTKPFTKGHIIDTMDHLICPGEIIPTLINPDYEEIVADLKEIQFYTPLLKGINIRIYWCNEAWNVSTVNEIITNIAINEINEEVNLDLLDRAKVYYATVTENNTTIVLRYIAEKKAPELALPQLDHDLAFTHHIPLIPFTIKPSELQQMMKTLHYNVDNSSNSNSNSSNSSNYGLVLFKQNGEQIELWNKHYYILKSMEKPDKVSIYTYYFYCLNKYAVEEEDDFEIIMIHLLCDINEFTILFPEHKEKCDSITKKIEEYCWHGQQAPIKNLKYLLSLDIEDAITLISPMPSRRNSFV